MGDLTITAGETVSYRLSLLSDDGEPLELSVNDRLLLVVRRMGQPVWHAVYTPAEDKTGWHIFWDMSHSETGLLQPGAYAWGLAYYQDAVLDGAIPIDGDVQYPIISGRLTVVVPTASEAGL